MNKIVLTILLFASSLFVCAQDVIVDKNGSTILSKVVEVGTTEIKYKKWNNLNGPNYSILKSEVQSINYENGLKDVFNEIQTTQPQAPYKYQGQIATGVLENNRLEKEKLIANSESWKEAGVWVGTISFLGGMIVGLILEGDVKEDFFDNTTYLACTGAGLAVGIIGISICNSISNKKLKLAQTITASHILKHYYEMGNSTLSTSVDLLTDNLTNNRTLGLGMSLNF